MPSMRLPRGVGSDSAARQPRTRGENRAAVRSPIPAIAMRLCESKYVDHLSTVRRSLGNVSALPGSYPAVRVRREGRVAAP